jgi:hypothetical protein
MPPAEAPTFAPQVCWDPAVQRYMETVFGVEHLAKMQARAACTSALSPLLPDHPPCWLSFISSHHRLHAPTFHVEDGLLLLWEQECRG